MATIDLSSLPVQKQPVARPSVNPTLGTLTDSAGFIGALGNSATAAAAKGLGYGTSALLGAGEWIANKTGLSGDLPSTYQSASQMVKDATDKLVSNFTKGGESYTNGQNVAKGIGNFTGSVAGQIPFLAAGQEALTPLGFGGGSASKLANATGFVAKSLGRTTIAKETSTGQLPSKGELGGWLAVDTALLGASTLFNKFYQSAFTTSSGIPKKQLENYVKEFGQTPGEMAQQNYGYMGSSSGIKDTSYQAGQDAWKQLVDLGKTGKSASAKDVMDMVTKAVQPLIKDLPAGSPAANDITDSAIKIVAYFSPADAKVLTQENIRAILKNINSDLFGQGSKLVINPATVDDITLAIKQGFKDLLPKGSRELITTYAQNNMIWNIMNSENVKRIVGRSIIGTTGGAAAGFSTAKIGGKNWADSIIQGLAGGLAGFALANALDSTWVKTVVGNSLGTAFNPAIGGQLLKTAVDTSTPSNITYPTLKR